MHSGSKKVLLLAMPFAGIAIPSIQLSILEGYLKEHGRDIVTKNLYLKAAESYGVENYNFLITNPNDSYTAQMVFSRYVFPEHWDKNENKFREYFKKILSNNKEFSKKFTFDEYLEKTDDFYNWVIENIDWGSFDFIGFTLNYGQFLPSLSIAKKIKEINPQKKIIFGGSRTVGELGKRVLESFDYVDFIVSGDGEEALFLLTSGDKDYSLVPNLMYRNGKDIIHNESKSCINLNDVSIPSYDSFYVDLYHSSDEIQQFFQYHGRLPVEISRGCWWNKCSFCNYSISLPNYREKRVEKIVEEIDYLSKKYSMLNFQIIGNTLPKKEYLRLFKEIIKLEKDFDFFAEARAGQMKSDDYILMKKAGFRNIQMGIESFSKSYLKKINKGARVIDNIAALKFCKEQGIKNEYNILVEYPNEEKKDFEETAKNISLFKKYLDPPNINKLLVGYGSYIFKNPEIFNIDSLDYTNIDKLMFPEEFLDKCFSFYYDFKRKKEVHKNEWEPLIKNWEEERQDIQIKSIKNQTPINNLILFYVDGVNFIKIYDKRREEQTRIYVLNEEERKLFLSCDDIISKSNLMNKFKDIDLKEIENILNSFVKAGIVYEEEEYYLSLPISYKKFYNNETIQKKDSKLQVLN